MRIFSLIMMALLLFLGRTLEAQPDPDHILAAEGTSGLADGEATISVTLDLQNAPRRIQGWSWGLCDDLGNAHVVDEELGADAAALNGGTGPQTLLPTIWPGEGWTTLAVVTFQFEDSLFPGGFYELHRATYELGEVGTANLSFCDTLGISPVSISLVDDQNPTKSIEPTLIPAEIVIEPSRPGMLRGDCDHSGTFSGVPDGLFALNFQFIPGSPVPPCLAECDANGDEVFNALVDGLFIFNFAFIPGSEPIPAPFFGCDSEDGTGIDSMGVLGCDDTNCVFPL